MFSRPPPGKQADTGLRVRPGAVMNLPFPQFDKPRPIGYFSVVGGVMRDYEQSAQNLHYYRPPLAKNFPLNLNEGISLAIKKPESAYNEKLDNLLKFVYDNKRKRLTESEIGLEAQLNVEFICWRGLLRLLMCTPYEKKSNWRIHATRHQGTIYLCKFDSEEDKYERANETEKQRTMSSWGFKFEQYCLSESPFIEPDTSTPVDECSEFGCVFVTKLGGINILYGAEMDGIISEQPIQLEENGKLENAKFVELKVRQGNLNKYQWDAYKRHKTRNWWCQSFLVGIQDIYVGLRTDTGMVQKIERMEVRSLPKQGAKFWTPAVCAIFVIDFFKYLKSLMADVNCPNTTYAFYYNASTGQISYEVLQGKTEYSFLPDWYIEGPSK